VALEEASAVAATTTTDTAQARADVRRRIERRTRCRLIWLQEAELSSEALTLFCG
jgi:hypothetical protein